MFRTAEVSQFVADMRRAKGLLDMPPIQDPLLRLPQVIPEPEARHVVDIRFRFRKASWGCEANSTGAGQQPAEKYS
jgi:hypothetical protein